MSESAPVVLVTGGSRGIGRAVVEAFASEGADVTFFYRSRRDEADRVVESGRARGWRIAAEAVDVRSAADCDSAVRRLGERAGRIDVLVNNAGIARDQLLGMLDDRDLGEVIDTNVAGVFHVTRAVVPHMVARRSGRIVNVSSVVARRGGRGQTSYAASKGAVEAFTRALAVELGGRGITVNAVAPGMIETDMTADLRPAAGDEVKRRIALGRFGTTEDVAHAVVFLASPGAAYITGQVLGVDGGLGIG
jgi:3-oxoacyl-[acyl-carrier protein] reductase